MDHHLNDLYLCRALSISPQPSLLRETQQKLDDYFCSQKHHAVISSCGILARSQNSLRITQGPAEVAETKKKVLCWCLQGAG